MRDHNDWNFFERLFCNWKCTLMRNKFKKTYPKVFWKGLWCWKPFWYGKSQELKCMLRRAHVLCLCDPRLKAAEDVSHVHWREEARRDDAENLLQMHLVYTFSFVVVLVTLIATLSLEKQSLFTGFNISKRDLILPYHRCSQALLQFPNHWSTFRNAFPLSCLLARARELLLIWKPLISPTFVWKRIYSAKIH